MKNVPQARKFLHDWLDSTRPWAEPNVNVYVMMQEIVDRAAMYFADDVRPTRTDVAALEAALLRFTEPLTDHPEDYDGPCACEECRSE